MNMRLGCRVLFALMFIVGACKNKDNPLNTNLFRSAARDADEPLRPLPQDAPVPPKTSFTVGVAANPEAASDNTPIERTLKKEQKGAVPPGIPPPPPPLLPPGPLPPLVPDGFVEYDGPISSLCGNGVIDKIFSFTTCIPIPNATCVPFLYLEQCDDANHIGNDGCSSSCMKECCGNGIIEEGEQCDVGQRTGALPPNFSPPAGWPPSTIVPAPDGFPAIPQSACSSNVVVTDSGNCSRHCQLIICGDGVVNGPEECDDGNDQCCDGCFKCRLELPNTCPCNCVPPNVRCPDPSKPCPDG